MKTKNVARLNIKDADKGEVEAVFATLDVIDADKDVTLKGAFEDGAPVRISPWGHSIWPSKGSREPVGKGSIRETKTEAIMDGRFFMDTQAGHDTFVVVKEMSEEDGPGQEWSYGFDELDVEFGQKDGKRVRFLKQLKVHEVSPVLLGAGVDTRVLSVKSAKELPGGRTVNELRALLREALDETLEVPENNAWMWVVDFTDEFVIYELEGSGWSEPGTYQADYTVTDDGVAELGDPVEVEERREFVPKSQVHAVGMKFSEQTRSVLSGVDDLLERAEEVVSFRSKRGRDPLSQDSVEILGQLDARMKRLDALLREPAPSDALVREHLRFIRDALPAAT